LSNTEPIAVVENSAPQIHTSPSGVVAGKDHGLLPSIQSLLATVIIAVFVISFVVQAFQIPSESMENTLLIGDYLLVNKLRYGGKSGSWVVPYERVRRGDIIVFHYPVNPTQHFVKRVIGVPGDHVKLINRQVWVNGLPMKEPYARYALSNHDVYRDDFPQVDYIAPGEEPLWFKQQKQVVQQGELIVPKDQYFVMGDNRDMSLDSRYWGFVPRENIIGTPLLIYWSIRSTDEMAGPTSASDKLFRFGYALTHLFQMTRWDRTFRLVH
jgi:signal peptidase I